MTIKNGRLEAKMTRTCISVLVSFRLIVKILNFRFCIITCLLHCKKYYINIKHKYSLVYFWHFPKADSSSFSPEITEMMNAGLFVCFQVQNDCKLIAIH